MKIVFNFVLVDLQAAICISIDYPALPPLFSLRVTKDDGSKIADDSVRVSCFFSFTSSKFYTDF